MKIEVMGGVQCRSLRFMLFCILAGLLALPASAGEEAAKSAAGPATPPGAAPAAVTANGMKKKDGDEPPPPPPPLQPAAVEVVAKISETFLRGGTIMWVLLLTSIIGLTFVVERMIGLRRGTHIPAKLLEQVQECAKERGSDAARLLVKGHKASLARVLDGLLARKGATRQELEKVLEDETSRVLWGLRHNIRPVGIVASVAPLIGLLGTVFGLIKAFQKAAELGMDDPRNFAEGIYAALYTTAFGLTIAIPFLIIYHYLRGRADVLIREVEDQAIGFIIEYDAWQSEAGQQ